MSDSLTFSEFVELILASLYDFDREKKTEGYIDLNLLAQRFRERPTLQWIWDAGKVLQSRMLADCIFAIGGGAWARITGNGRLYVEEQRGSGLIKKYRQHPDNYVVVSGDNNQVVVGGRDANGVIKTEIAKERKPALDIVLDIERIIAEDVGLSSDAKSDLMADLAAVKAQLQKREPNRTVLAALLGGMAQIPSIASRVGELIHLMNP